MKAVLLRTSSSPYPVGSGSPPPTLSVRAFVGMLLRKKKLAGSICSRSDFGRDVAVPATRIRRALSETELLRSGGGSHVFPGTIQEEGTEVEGSVVLETRRSTRIPAEEMGFQGSNGGSGCRNGGDNENDGFSGSNEDRRKIRAYYEQMLKSNPTDFLLLSNYAKFLHQVEKDEARAEEYYGRAILACPGDGEVLSLYASLIWEKDRDESRAEAYFEQAIHASPHDSTVLGSYARFMWDAAEDDGDDGLPDGAVNAPPAVTVC